MVEVPEGELANLKSEMSSLDIAAITFELVSLIKAKYLDNVYQTDTKTFLFKFRPGDLNLIVEVGRRIHLTKYEIRVPKQPSQFCMALRKRLRAGRVIDVRQLEFERVVIFEIEGAGETWQIVAEFFPRGNLVVVDKSGRISLAMSHVKMRDRDIVKGEVFKHAPSSGSNPFTISREELSHIRDERELPTSKALVMTLSIGGPLAREILSRAELQDEAAGRLTDDDLDRIYHTIQSLRSRLLKNDFDPTVGFDERGEPYDIAPFPKKSFEHLEQRHYPTFNEAADEYFTNFAQRILLDRQRETVSVREQELGRVKTMQWKQMEDLSKAIKENSLKGQGIMSNLHYLQEILSEISVEKEKRLSPKEISDHMQATLLRRKVPIQVRSIDLARGILSATIEDLDLNLDITKKPQHEADRYFQAAKKAKEKMIGLQRAMERTITKMKAVDMERQQADILPSTKKRKEKSWYEKFRWFFSSEDLLVIAGKDATTNEILIKKYADPADIVFHAETHGAPFVVVKTETRAPSTQTILEAAQFAVAHSGMWAAKAASADVYWIHSDQVSKEAPSGQYLTKGAFMITGKRNYIKGLELRLAIGIQVDQDNVRVIGGPPSAIQSRAVVHVEILPGNTARHRLAKQILFELSKMPSINSKVRALSPDQLLDFLPSGSSDIVPSQRPSLRNPKYPSDPVSKR